MITIRHCAAAIRGGIIVGLAGILSFGVSGCCRSTSDPTNDNPQETTTAGDNASANTVSLERAISEPGVYVLQDSKAISQPFSMQLENSFSISQHANGSGTLYTYGASSADKTVENLPDGYYGLLSTNLSSSASRDQLYLTVDSSNNDQLIATMESNIQCSVLRVRSEGYWPGLSFRIDTADPSASFNEYPVGNNLTINGSEIDIAELDGIDVSNTNRSTGSGADEALAVFASRGFRYEEYDFGEPGEHWSEHLLSSSEPGASITIGYYQGSTYDEFNMSFDSYYYFVDNLSEVQLTRTKDGYCVIDTSQLAPGHYVLAMGELYESPSWYAINII